MELRTTRIMSPAVRLRHLYVTFGLGLLEYFDHLILVARSVQNLNQKQVHPM
jgi:hypothetical protein